MSKNQQFQKFITYKSNAAKKEQFKQEKRSVKKERAAAIEKRFEEKRQAKSGEYTRDAVKGRPAAENHTAPAPEKQHPNKTGRKPAAIEQPAGKNRPPVSTKPNVEDLRQPAPPTEKRTTGKKQPRLPKPGSLEEKKLLAAAARSGVQPAGTALSNTAEGKPETRTAGSSPQPVKSGMMPLNKYVAHSGICSRRDAAELIRKGDVQVNDTVVTEPGTKVSPKDIITIKGKKITPSKNLVYILLNKPKDYITTLDDPEGRKTVLDLIKRSTDERVYPVGRLDRNTSGVLLITNDGDLAQTLSHPSNLIKKIYEVRLDRALTKADFEKLQVGLQLEDGFIMPDALGYTDPKDKTIIGIEIHSGRNRIVRRIFEHLGYDVRNLDRVTYAGLTKKKCAAWKMAFSN